MPDGGFFTKNTCFNRNRVLDSQSLGNLDRRYRVGYGSTNLTKKMKQVLPIKSKSIKSIKSKYWVYVLKEIHFLPILPQAPSIKGGKNLE